MGSTLAIPMLTSATESLTQQLSNTDQPISDEQLKAISRSWTQDQWEAYLKTIEIPNHETLLSDSELHRIIENKTESIFVIAQSPCSPETSARVWQAIQQLTARQREIIHLIYWRGISERDVARQLGITRSSVQVLKRRALQRMKEVLSSILHM